ncbi:MAG: alpha/beta hydrolase [Acetobacter sp.]|nr:alpha/beta hydrolase [Bacteroides sp.]MCM1341178.1 alpha/beta hydrolase [Acetobacter sp.]MCM1433821.1 alpha/beta hydrolase [Clostridiales bacterium]
MFTQSHPKIYYEKTGTGKPLILVHGNKETHKIFDKLIDELKDSFTIYALDSRGHGQSDRVNEYHYADMADDVLRLIEEEGIEKPSFFGFSDGGIIGILCAVKSPDKFDKIIIAGANITVNGLKTVSLLGMKLNYLITRDKLTKMMLKEPNISISSLKKITCPVLVLAGEWDIIKKEHTKLIAKSISNSQLIIFKHKGHGDYIVHNAFTAETIKTFIL